MPFYKNKKFWIIFGIVIGAMLLLASVITFFKLKADLEEKNDLINKSAIEMKQLKDEIVRSKSTYATPEDLENFADDLGFKLENIQKDMDKFDATLQAINSISAKTPGYIGNNLPSSSENPLSNPLPPNLPCENGVCKNPDKYGYLNSIQVFKMSEPFSVALNIPYGRMLFDATQEKPWTYEVSSREYKLNTVLTQDEDGRHYAYNQFLISVDGKDYKVPLQKAEIVEKVPESEFRFSPRLYLGMSAGASVNTSPSVDESIAEFEAMPSLEFSFFSYGPTKKEPELTFLNVGIGIHINDPKPAAVISPINYNLGQHLPFIDNLFIGPSVSIDSGGDFGIMGGLRVGL